MAEVPPSSSRATDKRRANWQSWAVRRPSSPRGSRKSCDRPGRDLRRGRSGACISREHMIMINMAFRCKSGRGSCDPEARCQGSDHDALDLVGRPPRRLIIGRTCPRSSPRPFSRRLAGCIAASGSSSPPGWTYASSPWPRAVVGRDGVRLTCPSRGPNSATRGFPAPNLVLRPDPQHCAHPREALEYHRVSAPGPGARRACPVSIRLEESPGGRRREDSASCPGTTRLTMSQSPSMRIATKCCFTVGTDPG